MTPPEPEHAHDQAPQSGHSATSEALNAAGRSRRTFLFKLSLVLNGAVGVVLAVPIVGYLLGPAAKKAAAANSWVPLGPLADFPEGQTRLVNFRNPVTTKWDGATGDIPCWVRRIAGNKFQVFAINCAHLGCPVRWFSQSQLFLCPCHGGAYYADGSRASGPPERGLFEYDHKIIANTLMIQVGKLPNLSRQTACAGQSPLVHIEGAATVASIQEPKPECASCQG
ncbi:ubiquinol-cytochrome c reductase iron-sulfur subunit [Edaphobacter sp.]|uniref:QcrA and Rieske domain-containing protein n=1 Tax=Edaphobacter sp. TaxID=1934404 RepID=UPI002DB70FA4|nr:Rieske 2Fe-2S domain-containing protein [Edaphobacter sp.]HEU5342224.1 Rieske 2Fe-2S domain-containing protein [Edaphobacter sp.]